LDWEASGRSSENEAGWEEKLARLVAYKAEHGDCKVPKRWAEDRPLGRWVGIQRAGKKALDRGEPSAVMTVRVAKLTALGFAWAGDPRRRRSGEAGCTGLHLEHRAAQPGPKPPRKCAAGKAAAAAAADSAADSTADGWVPGANGDGGDWVPRGQTTGLTKPSVNEQERAPPAIVEASTPGAPGERLAQRAAVKAELRAGGLPTHGGAEELTARLAEHGHGWTEPDVKGAAVLATKRRWVSTSNPKDIVQPRGESLVHTGAGVSTSDAPAPKARAAPPAKEAPAPAPAPVRRGSSRARGGVPRFDPGPGPPGAVKRPSRFPQYLDFLRHFCMGAHGA
jgi:hypothetical protein